MKKYLSLAFGIALLLGMAISMQRLNAQVYSEYEAPALQGDRQFYDITAASTHVKITDNEFFLPPDFANPNRDDGYAEIDLGFPFEFNGYVYTKVWVCVNGFVQFLQPGQVPLFIPADYPKALFISSSSYPKNVVAPFWGDHYYRTAVDNIGKVLGTDNLFTETDISYFNYTDTNNRRSIVIQWKDLNINYEDPVTHLPVTSSVATFQVIIHEQIEGPTKQGNIEFAYGPAGADLSISREQKVISAGSSVGIKGESTDFMNGLAFREGDIDFARKDTTLTGAWQPSNGTDTNIVFIARAQLGDESWGDGDVDFSKVRGNKHFGLDQNRYVTVNDAWLIMRSIATGVPLDSVRKRAAYHGDVNHNGRYFYDPDSLVVNPKNGLSYPVKKNITWRDMNYRDNLDNPEYSVSDINQLYFQVSEYDAAMILNYITARLPYLPWVLDTVPLYGRIVDNDAVASSIKFGNAEYEGQNTYLVPVYLNGYTNNPMAFKFDVNGEVIDVQKCQADGQNIQATYEPNRVVVIGNGEFTPNTPVCFVKVRTNENNVNFDGIRFNDKENGSYKLMLTSVENSGNEFDVQTVPNPFTDLTVLNINIPASGNYTLTVYDGLGNKVKLITSSEMEAGLNTFQWDGTDESGNNVESGAYIFRLTGENTTVSQKVILAR